MLPDQISRRKMLRLGVIAAGTGAFLVLASGSVTNLLRQLRRGGQPVSTSSVPSIVPRADWGARPPDHEAVNEFGFAASPMETEWYVYTDNLVDVYNTVAIHHSSSLLIANETMADIQRIHMDVNGWADIGYHYGIDREGIIYEGREIQSRGASVTGYNTGTIGVVVMGNFEEENPLPAQLTALQTLVNWLTLTYGLSHLAGHGEFNPESVCPGKNLTVYLDQFAEDAGLKRGTEGHVRPTA